MILNKLKQVWTFIWGTQVPVKENSTSRFEKEQLCDKIDRQIDKTIREKAQIKFTPLEIPQPDIAEKNIGSSFRSYSPYKITETRSLKELKEIRLKREAEELELLKKKSFELLDQVNLCLKEREIKKAKSTLSKVAEFMPLVNAIELERAYQQANSSYENLVEILDRENRQRLEEARKREEEEEKRRLEEQERLRKLSEDRKLDWREFEKILEKNGIVYLYHFTDKRNLSSIKKHGGLFSWSYCQRNNIAIPCQGGDYQSKELDKKYGLEDYVRLSFCKDHPMAFRLEQAGSKIALLKIKVDVAYLKDTLFSDMNAADKRHKHGGNIEDLRRVNFAATKMSYLRGDDPNFKAHQAEVMVKTLIPLKYIVNINEV